MRKLVFSFAAALAAFSAFADFPFSDFGAKAAAYFTDQNIPSPKALNYADAGELKAKLTALDADGKTITTEFTIDKSDVEGSISAALEGLRSTVNTATINAARALAQAAALAEMVYDNAEAIEQILTALYRIFTDLATLEIRNPEDNTAEKIPMKVEGDTVYINNNFMQLVRVDDVSVDTNSAGKLQLLDFNYASAGQIPYIEPYGSDHWLTYHYFGWFFDSAVFAGQTNISLKGWNVPTHDSDHYPGFCGDSLAAQLTRDSETVDKHYVLTAYGSGGGEQWDLHYTPVGLLTNLAAQADLPWSWDARSGTFRNPWVQVANRTITATGAASGDGSYYVAVDMAQGTAVLTKGTTPASDDNMAYFTIGTVEGGKLTSGIKSMPVCIYWQ